MLSSKLEPGVRQLLEAAQSAGYAPLETLDPVAAREQMGERFKAVAGPSEPMASVEDRSIGDFSVRIYTPDAAAPRPGLVYFHGGGWVIASVETHDGICRGIAKIAGATVVSVAYRLAPEHKFPAAVDDCYAATVWTAEHAAELGIDPGRLSVGGDSAGGNLATVVCMKCRDEHGPAIASQEMVYPVTDLSTFETESYREFAEDHQLTKAGMEWFRDHYVSEADRSNPHVSPLLAQDLRGLPPALILTAECDLLRDEGEAYARRLEEAGVPVTCTRYGGMIHGFFSMSGVIPRALDAFQQVAEAVKSAATLKRMAAD